MKMFNAYDKFGAENTDYIPTSEVLEFLLVTNYTQCVTVSVVEDNVLENSEEFLLQAENSSLVTPSPSIVTVTIVDDDCKSK